MKKLFFLLALIVLAGIVDADFNLDCNVDGDGSLASELLYTTNYTFNCTTAVNTTSVLIGSTSMVNYTTGDLTVWAVKTSPQLLGLNMGLCNSTNVTFTAVAERNSSETNTTTLDGLVFYPCYDTLDADITFTLVDNTTFDLGWDTDNDLQYLSVSVDATIAAVSSNTTDIITVTFNGADAAVIHAPGSKLNATHDEYIYNCKTKPDGNTIRCEPDASLSQTLPRKILPTGEVAGLIVFGLGLAGGVLARNILRKAS